MIPIIRTVLYPKLPFHETHPSSPAGLRAGVNGQLAAHPLLGELLCLGPTGKALLSLQLRGRATALQRLAEAGGAGREGEPAGKQG